MKLEILFLNKIVSQIKNRSSADGCKRLVSDVFIVAMTKVQQVWLSRLQLQIISRERTMRPADTAACPRYPTAADTAPSVGCTMTFDLRLLRHSQVMLQQTLAHGCDCMCMYTLKLTMRQCRLLTQTGMTVGQWPSGHLSLRHSPPNVRPLLTLALGRVSVHCVYNVISRRFRFVVIHSILDRSQWATPILPTTHCNNLNLGPLTPRSDTLTTRTLRYHQLYGKQNNH